MRSVGTTRIRAFDQVAMRAAREQKKWSRGRLAVLLGVTPPAVASWEKGTTTPEPPTFVRLAKLLDLDPAALIATPQTSWTLTDLRVSHGLHQAPAAEQIGMAATRLSDLEMGYDELREPITESLAQMYGVTTDVIENAWRQSRERLLTDDQ